MFLKKPELEISEDEAKKLAQAIKGVMQYHSITVNPKHVAYIQLIGVCAAIYGPRAYMMFLQAKAKQELQQA